MDTKNTKQTGSSGQDEPKKDDSGIKINFNPIVQAGSQPQAQPLAQFPAPKPDLKVPSELIQLNLNAAELKGGVKKMENVAAPSKVWGDALKLDPNAPIKTDLKIDKPESKIELKTDKVEPKVDLKTTPELPVDIKGGFFLGSKNDEKSASSQILENIASQKAKLEEPKIESLLGKSGSGLLQKSLEEEKLDKLKRKVRSRKLLTLLVLLIVVGANGYLWFQLNSGLNLFGFYTFNFENNLFNSAQQTNTNLESVQTNANKFRYLTGQLYLNQFSFDMTKFFDGVAAINDPATVNSRADIVDQLTQIKTEAPQLLASAKENLTVPVATALVKLPQSGEDTADINPDVPFQTDLRKAIGTDKAALLATVQSGGQTENLPRDIDFLDNTNSLVGNSALLNNLNALTPEQLSKGMDDYQNLNDPAQKAKFKNQIDSLLGVTKNPLALISKLKNGRVNWTVVLQKVNLIAQKVNSEHSGTSGSSEITFSNFDLSSDGKKISFTGLNKTSDGTNREVVTFLIQALEDSADFKNVTDRSFPLSKETDTETSATSFSMNFKVDMEIETGTFDSKNAPVVSFVENAINKVKRNN